MEKSKWLKTMRLKKGLTQKELAKKIGLSVFTIQNIEQGQRKGSESTWEKILNFFERGESPKISYDSEEEKPITDDELYRDEELLSTTLGDALKLFERQNSIIK